MNIKVSKSTWLELIEKLPADCRFFDADDKTLVVASINGKVLKIEMEKESSAHTCRIPEDLWNPHTCEGYHCRVCEQRFYHVSPGEYRKDEKRKTLESCHAEA